METAEKNQKRETYHHGDLRAGLIEATRQLVEEKGPDLFSVSEACRRAGVSTAAPYKHFKDKSEMLLAVTVAGMERHQVQIVQALSSLKPRSIERIMAMGREYIAFAVAEPGVFRLMFGLSEHHGDQEDLMTKGINTFQMVQQEVAAYRGSDIVEPIDEHRAFLLWSFVHGLSFLLIDGKITKMALQLDIEMVLRDVAERVMSDTTFPSLAD